MSKSNSSGGGLGIVGVLTLIFVVLKLVGVISWSWWWVLSPLWLPLAAMFAVAVIWFTVASIIKGIKGMSK